jgi:GPI-anchor transamidase subunit T
LPNSISNEPPRQSPVTVPKLDTNYNLLPKSFIEIIRAYEVEELHLTFTKGRWSVDRQGMDGPIAPIGVQLYTWLSSGDVDVKWKGLTNALAGQRL